MQNPAQPDPRPLVIEMDDVAVSLAHDPQAVEVEGISWKVAQGEFWAIGGFHGLGKSNFLATVAGLQSPMRGTIKLFGREIVGMKENELVQERLRIGFVFEAGGRMLRHLTVTENVALPLRYHRDWTADDAEERVKEILECTELTPIAHSTAGTISPNWQQRVGLARALALQPDLLLLDKPLIGLKANHREWWLQFLSRLAAGLGISGGRPITLVATADELRSWKDVARQFASVQKRRWLVLGGRDELEGRDSTA